VLGRCRSDGSRCGTPFPALVEEFRCAAESIRDEVIANAWHPVVGSFVGHYGGQDLDASLLQMAPLRFLPPRDPRLHGTIDAIRKGLGADGWLFRYRLNDGLGQPSVAFVICTFWLIEALAVAGRHEEAEALMEQIHPALSPLGLLSEDYETSTLGMWGNFPQAYSHVVLIRAAFAASPTWPEVL
jgi:GH15 family glucan-1,4-alpha-glucosidase